MYVRSSFGGIRMIELIGGGGGGGGGHVSTGVRGLCKCTYRWFNSLKRTSLFCISSLTHSQTVLPAPLCKVFQINGLSNIQSRQCTKRKV